MPRKKKSKGGDTAVPQSSSMNSGRLSTDISDAENGLIVYVSGETGGKKSQYFQKRYIANDRSEALRIASSCMAAYHHGGSKKTGKKKSKTIKKIAAKG